MFTVVTQKKIPEFEKEMQQMHRCLIDVYGKDYRDAYDHDETMYLLYSHKKFGVIGGARIIPSGRGAIMQDFLSRIKIEGKNKVFEVSRVFFHIPNEGGLKESEAMYNVIRRDFYQGFYEALKTISIAQKVKTFVSVLSEEEHQMVKEFGMWPFDREGRVLLPKLSKSPFVAGLLPMSQKLYEKFLDQRQDYELGLRFTA